MRAALSVLQNSFPSVGTAGQKWSRTSMPLRHSDLVSSVSLFLSQYPGASLYRLEKVSTKAHLSSQDVQAASGKDSPPPNCDWWWRLWSKASTYDSERVMMGARCWGKWEIRSRLNWERWSSFLSRENLDRGFDKAAGYW